MRIKSTRIKIIFLITTAIFFSKSSSVLSNPKILATDHFIINYNLDNSSCAFAISAKMESCYESISSFLEYETSGKIEVFITDEKQPYNNTTSLITNGALTISAYRNFNSFDNLLYIDIFKIFLDEILNNRKFSETVEKTFLEQIINYASSERNFIDLVLNDLVNFENISYVKLNEINKYRIDEQQIIYTALIDYIISTYGKKILLQSLLDSFYYKGFFKSLSMITGDHEQIITENFNTFIKNQRSLISVNNNIKKILLNKNIEFRDISYSISEKGQLAVLQKKDNDSRLLLKNEKNDIEINLKHSENCSDYNKINFIGKNMLSVIEITGSGSILHIYDIEHSRFLKKFSLPYIFISEIKSESDKSLIFSAMCGINSDIYSINLNTGEFTVLTETGCNTSPVAIGGKIYFILKTNKTDLIEMNRSSGEIKTLYSTVNNISRLNLTDENKIIFSINSNSVYSSVFCDLRSGNITPLIGDINTSLETELNRNTIYFFSYYMGKYRIFFSDLNMSVK